MALMTLTRPLATPPAFPTSGIAAADRSAHPADITRSIAVNRARAARLLKAAKVRRDLADEILGHIDRAAILGAVAGGAAR